jgi:hypothetical protein
MLVLFNLFLFLLVGIVHVAGGVEAALRQGAVGQLICGLIVMLFFVSLYYTWRCGRQIELEADAAEKGGGKLLAGFKEDFAGDRGIAKDLLEEETESWSAEVSYITQLMPRLGMLGTVIGLLMAIDLSAFAGKDLSDFMMEIVFQLFSGLGVAFYTTVFGLIFAIWNSANHYVLEAKTGVLNRIVVRKALGATGGDHEA